MPEVVSKIGSFPAIAVATVLGSAAISMLPWIVCLGGRPRGEWPQFLERFHPLVMHLPISLFLLPPLLETAGRSWPVLGEAAALVLWVGLLSCVIAASLGFLLAYDSGDATGRVMRHIWGGVALTVVVALCTLARSSGEGGWPGRLSEWGHRLLLAVAAVLLLRATHQGGSLTHGDRYLTEHVPATLQRWPVWRRRRGDESVTPDLFSALQIDPTMRSNCVSCHGSAKVKARLRLACYARLMHGREDGAVAVPGDAEKSLLFKRITLPLDQKKSMPSEGKPPLQPPEILMVKAWIEDSASPQTPSMKRFAMSAIEAAPAGGAMQEPEKVGQAP